MKFAERSPNAATATAPGNPESPRPNPDRRLPGRTVPGADPAAADPGPDLLDQVIALNDGTPLPNDPLKPCPFCGNPAPRRPTFQERFVLCPRCGARGPNADGAAMARLRKPRAVHARRVQALIAAWNHREAGTGEGAKSS
jgi:hypothetical protein